MQTMIEPVISYPPPPKTVKVWNPHISEMVDVHAYAHSKDLPEPMQRVQWNPTAARWEVDPERAEWKRQSANANAVAEWTLVTNWPEDVRKKKVVRQMRDRQDATEARLAEVERQLQFLLDQFEIQLPGF